MTDSRYELKFVLNERESTQFRFWLAANGAKKKYPDRKVNSLYFDNTNLGAVRDNLAGIADRNKIRLRWYGNTASPKSNFHLEIKVREGRLGSKILYPLTLTHDFFASHNISLASQEIFRHVSHSFFTHHAINEFLMPTLVTSYNREYYENSKNMRVTIDKKICFFDPMNNQKLGDIKPLKYRPVVAEIKFAAGSKDHVAGILRNSSLSPKRHSKYLTGLSMLGYASYI